MFPNEHPVETDSPDKNSWPPAVEPETTTSQRQGPLETGQLKSAALLGGIFTFWCTEIAISQVTYSTVKYPLDSAVHLLGSGIWGLLALTGTIFTIGALLRSRNRLLALTMLRWGAIAVIPLTLTSIFPLWYETQRIVDLEMQGKIPGDHPFGALNGIAFWIGIIVDTLTVAYCIDVLRHIGKISKPR